MIPFLKILMIVIWLVSQISFLTNTLLVSLFSHFFSSWVSPDFLCTWALYYLVFNCLLFKATYACITFWDSKPL